jgi:formate dehydrogenase iron-sulfur subunit
MAKGLLIDTTRCIGCGACSDACRESNDLQGEATPDLSANTFTVLMEQGDHYVRKLCMHCEDPSCASVCPVAALKKSPTGAVTYDTERCIGCRYCMIACPFDIPRYEWSSNTPYVRKCEMCPSRVNNGQETACAEACYEGATVFGERDELLEEARRRQQEDPDTYADHIYGEDEAGGTSTLYLLPKDVEQLGLKAVTEGAAYPQLTWNVLSKIPSLALVLGTALGGVWWITGRREEVRRAEETEDNRFGSGGDTDPQA